jgi:DNA repair protein RadA/Sms
VPGPSAEFPPFADPVPLASVDPAASRPWSTGVGEVDRVLAGGLTPGSVTLLFGEPGVGKSTLLLQVLAGVARSGAVALLVSAEESAPQVRARADRLGVLPDELLVLATSEVEAVEHAVAACTPRVMVVDSVQTIADHRAPGAPGSLAQVRECADRLASVARRDGVAVVLVGHVTKDGDMAGPRTLEHLVDTVLSFEGDRHHPLRVLRAMKHRFGPTGEVGLFEMGEAGLRDVAEPGRLLLGDRRPEVPGSAVTALLEGRRPLLAEIQALTTTATPNVAPKRSTQGLDARRLGVLLAVLECRMGAKPANLDVYTSLAGGIRATEPATDLPVLLALASAATNHALPSDLLSFGEVGLAGEVRQVVGHGRRLAEAARLGFTRALVPASTVDAVPGMELLRVGTVSEALTVAMSLKERPPPAPRLAAAGATG